MLKIFFREKRFVEASLLCKTFLVRLKKKHFQLAFFITITNFVTLAYFFFPCFVTLYLPSTTTLMVGVRFVVLMS